MLVGRCKSTIGVTQMQRSWHLVAAVGSAPGICSMESMVCPGSWVRPIESACGKEEPKVTFKLYQETGFKTQGCVLSGRNTGRNSVTMYKYIGVIDYFWGEVLFWPIQLAHLSFNQGSRVGFPTRLVRSNKWRWILVWVWILVGSATLSSASHIRLWQYKLLFPSYFRL